MKKVISYLLSKPFVIVIIVLFIPVAIILMKYYTSSEERDVCTIEYRTDAQPIIDRFPSLPAFQECYWKADTIGRTDFGPTNYWIEGFIILKQTSYTKLLDEYSWESVDLKFTKGIGFTKGLDPAVTGFEEFDWCYNREFETKVMTASFLGYIYFDKQNGIVYFTLENN